MWIVRLALNKPYTFIVAAILIVVLGVASIVSTPTDIFPNIDIPVVTVIWSYSGLSAKEMEQRVTTFSEFVMAVVNDVKAIDSQTVNGASVIKISFQPQVRIDAAMSQIGAAVNSIRFRMPPGVNPPWILRFSASTVPIIQLSLSSDTLSESQLYDYGLFRVRQQLSTVPGTLLPAPYGGKARQIMVDMDQNALQAKGIAPTDVVAAINAQNLTLPSGTAKIGTHEYTVSTNSSPVDALSLNDVPVKTVNGSLIYMRDIAHVRDGWAVQQNISRADGKPNVLLSVMKTGSVSTLDIIKQIKNDVLPTSRAAAPKGMKITELFDQSLFVRASIEGVLREGIIAACLTALMILLFLGSWRSTLIIAISIPLSILSSIIVLSAMGETMNTMTLGGLALAIGILVDDATVTIENIHRHMGSNSLKDAVLVGASEIATPTFVSTLTICIVFVSVVFLTGPAKYLFTPMALAVVFAMLASYVLSRTLVPVMVNFLLGAEHSLERHEAPEDRTPARRSILARINGHFNRGYFWVQERYTQALRTVLHHRRPALFTSLAIMASAFLLLPFVGRDFFPSVDSGQIRLHVRALPGTRIETTKALVSEVEEQIRKTIPADQLDLIIDNIGLSPETFNYAFGDGATIGSSDGEILISLNAKHHDSASRYVKQLRPQLNREFPEMTFFFQPADIVTQILNFGLPSPIDVQVQGYDPANYEIARELRAQVATVPGTVDVRLHQVVNAPDLHLDIDRVRAAEFGLTQQDVANSIYISLSSSAAVQPNFWLDPKMGITYAVAAQTPQYQIDSINALQNTPIPLHAASNRSELLGNMATLTPAVLPQVINHHNGAPVFDIFANTQDSDLGSVAGRINKIVESERKHLPAGTKIVMRGQVESMNEAFNRLGLGLGFAALLVYLLMVVNYQSWLDPFIIICALPGAFCGIVWALFLTQTTFNVPSLMGAIMSIGVATANSILLVTFANELRNKGTAPLESAVVAGSTRLRPIIMTAFAMIVGMLPMALGLGEGGEQNAPLARAVIGGLSVATFATLFFVPLMFTLIHSKNSSHSQEVA
ncbi:efflux RND transporter permease subunit [Occallatibacter riparius]|uniref:Efflux RND transporter permease subunit n=1 Tax=Occallatibacter riparius TaxID=1002689 RepID=A0A9J7BVA0_9BACT|nr:efflux RND transporter permease subunit [Occallatibacter riparius]UWZ86804.1 efflux RND transporter permease subunit [Occallatibacter riparius]